MASEINSRWAWAITGSGHFLEETVALIEALDNLDLFLSRAAVEVLNMYKRKINLRNNCRVFRDKTASSAPIGAFYYGVYHTVIIAPATSNAVAKFVYGISDDLVSNIFAHAGKTRAPTIVFACDTAPEILTMAPKGPVKVYPRAVDLENARKLSNFADVSVVESTADLASAVASRQISLSL